MEEWNACQSKYVKNMTEFMVVIKAGHSHILWDNKLLPSVMYRFEAEMDWCQPQTRGSTQWENHKIKSIYDNIIQSMNVSWSQSHPIYPPNQTEELCNFVANKLCNFLTNNSFYHLIKFWPEWKDCWLECLWWQQLCEKHGWDLISIRCFASQQAW